MKRILLTILVIIICLAAFSGCSQNKTYTITEITDIKEQYPVTITVTFNDEYKGSCVITDSETIIKIVDLLKAREYTFTKDSPAPGSSRSLTLTYETGETVEVSTRIISQNGGYYIPSNDSIDSIVKEYGIESGDVVPR